MPVAILGVNHKTAPVAIREKVAFSPNEINSALISLKADAGLDEVVIISTCNRMEIVYRCAENVKSDTSESDKSEPDSERSQTSHRGLQTKQKIIHWLAEHHQLEVAQIDAHYYSHIGQQAITHLMGVACGLDSMVLGEPQILGQVKDAYG